MSSFSEKFKAANDYVNAIQDLPPTYQIGENAKFGQWIPDPTNAREIQIKQDRVRQASQQWDNVRKANIAKPLPRR